MHRDLTQRNNKNPNHVAERRTALVPTSEEWVAWTRLAHTQHARALLSHGRGEAPATRDGLGDHEGTRPGREAGRERTAARADPCVGSAGAGLAAAERAAAAAGAAGVGQGCGLPVRRVSPGRHAQPGRQLTARTGDWAAVPRAGLQWSHHKKGHVVTTWYDGGADHTATLKCITWTRCTPPSDALNVSFISNPPPQTSQQKDKPGLRWLRWRRPLWETPGRRRPAAEPQNQAGPRADHGHSPARRELRLVLDSRSSHNVCCGQHPPKVVCKRASKSSITQDQSHLHPGPAPEARSLRRSLRTSDGNRTGARLPGAHRKSPANS